MIHLLLLLLPFALLAGCTPAPGPGSASPTDAFTFMYEMDLGRDCFMMDDCGYRLVLSPDGTLRRLDDEGEEVASASLTAEERAVFLDQLEREGFFQLPALLPDVAEEEVPRGGRVVTMTLEYPSEGRSHRVEAHTDAVQMALPEQFYALEEWVRSYLSGRLGNG